MTAAIRVNAQRLAAMACVASLLAAACQERSKTATASQQPAETKAVKASDVCALVSKEVVAQIIAQPIVNTTAGTDSCKYETDDAMASSVEIVVKREGAAGEIDNVRKAAGVLGSLGAQMEGGKGAERDVGQALQAGGTLTGIGEQAFFDSTNTLHVLNKGAYVAVTPPMMKSRMGAGNPLLSADERQAMAKEIMLKVLAEA